MTVPVLSSTKSAGRESSSRNSPPLNRSPARAARESATLTARGVAIPSAHGHVTTNNATAWSSARVGSTTDHAANVMAASPSAAQTNQPATRSASLTIGARARCAASTLASKRLTRVAAPAASVRTRSVASVFFVPAYTRSPIVTVTGNDSPVNDEASTAEVPEATRPSTGKGSPARTSTMAFSSTARAGISTSPSTVTTRAVVGERAA